jgi:co-chaperonin GroES (HSP10)
LKDIMYKPLADKILVERVAGTHETSGGIILRSSQEPDKARILAIGPKVDEVAVGELCLLNWNAAIKAGQDQYVIAIEHVIFVYEEE